MSTQHNSQVYNVNQEPCVDIYSLSTTDEDTDNAWNAVIN